MECTKNVSAPLVYVSVGKEGREKFQSVIVCHHTADLMQDEESRLEMVQAFRRLKVVDDIIPSKVGIQEMGTHSRLHNHFRS